MQRLLQNPDLIAAEYERRLHQAQHPDADRSLIAQQMARGFVRFRPGENSGRTTVGYRWQKAVSKFDEGRFFILA